MDLAQVMQEIADRVDVIGGLRVLAWPPDGPPPTPAAIVTYPETYVYDETYGRGMDRMDLPVVVLVSKAYDRAARDQIAKWVNGSGDNSIKQALEFDRVYHAVMPGGVGDYVSTPDAAALDITGDLDLRVRVRMDDWTPAVQTWLLSKAPATGVQRSYALIVNPGGQLNLTWSATGSALLSEVSSVPLAATGVADGTTHWVRATLDVDNGAGDGEVTFYTSENGTTWTQLGSPQLVGATTAVFAGTSPLELGGRTAGASNLLAGRFYEAQVRNGIGGAVVTHPTAAQDGVTDSVGGLVYTLNGGVTVTYDIDDLIAAAYAEFDTVHVASVEFDVVRIGGVDYLSAALDLDITGQGA